MKRAPLTTLSLATCLVLIAAMAAFCLHGGTNPVSFSLASQGSDGGYIRLSGNEEKSRVFLDNVEEEHRLIGTTKLPQNRIYSDEESLSIGSDYNAGTVVDGLTIPYPFRPLFYSGGVYTVERLDEGTAEGLVPVSEYLAYKSLSGFEVGLGEMLWDASSVSFSYQKDEESYAVSVLFGHGESYLSDMPCSIFFTSSVELGKGLFVPSSFLYKNDAGSTIVYKVGFHDGDKVALPIDVEVISSIDGYSGLSPNVALAKNNLIVKV